jgi:hypothetical protein
MGVELEPGGIGMVGRLGFEPRTNDLKGRCSTIELSTRAERRGGKWVSATWVCKEFLPGERCAVIDRILHPA